MMKKFLSFITIFCGLSFSCFSYGIQPMYFEADISNGNGYREIFVINTNKLQKGRYKLTIEPGRNPQNDISKYMEIYPKVLNVAPDSVGLVKLYANIKEELPKDEYSFMFKITPIVIPTVTQEKEKISGNIVSPIAFQLEMFGHYGEVSAEELQEKINLKDYQIYEKQNKYGEKEIWVKGTLENNLYYGMVLSIKTESKGGTKFKTNEIGRVEKNGGKINFDFPVGNAFKNKNDIYSITILDLINYSPIKEILIKK